MKEYEVVIDLGSKTFRTEANNKEEAEKKALKLFDELPHCDKINERWVGDVEEVTE